MLHPGIQSRDCDLPDGEDSDASKGILHAPSMKNIQRLCITWAYSCATWLVFKRYIYIGLCQQSKTCVTMQIVYIITVNALLITESGGPCGPQDCTVRAAPRFRLDFVGWDSCRDLDAQ